MDALRALGNLAVMAVVSVIIAALYDASSDDKTTPFGTIWFVCFLLVWMLVAAMNGSGKSRRH